MAATGRVATRTGATPLVADLAGPDGPADLATRAVAVHGRVDALVAGAGVGWRGGLPEMPADRVDHLLAVNLRAPIMLTRALLPGMLDRGHGRVTLIASIAGLTGVASESVYAATKAGLIVFAESLRLETAGSGVGVAVVSPGAVATGFFDRRGAPYDRRLPRPISPDRVAAAVVRTLERDPGDAARDMVVPRWLAVAPRVRALAPRAYRSLARRFG
jgi:short-subunit dehydrogenase